MRAKHKKPLKVKYKLLVKIHLVFFTLEWQIEVGK